MKNILIGMAIALCIAAGAVKTDILTIKPSVPKSTIVISGWNTSELNNNIKPYLKNGYIVKNLSVGDGCRAVVMEKY